MKLHFNTVPAFAGAFLLSLLFSACSTQNPAAKRLHLHPAGETRMSDKPRPGYVATNVWRVKGRSGNTIYLAGTCHVVPDSEIPFPSSYYAAYQDSDDVFLEVDDTTLSVKLMVLGALPDVLRFFVDHGVELRNPDGRKLSDSLSPKTDKLLRAHYGSGYSGKQSLTPLGLLVSHELMGDSGPEQGGVDDYFKEAV